MNSQESNILDRITDLIGQMNDEQRERLMAFAEGIAFALERKAG